MQLFLIQMFILWLKLALTWNPKFQLYLVCVSDGSDHADLASQVVALLHASAISVS